MTGLINTPQKAWKVIKDKGPVNIPVVQEKVQRCLDVLKPYLSKDDWDELNIARGHSESGEGREEWDMIVKKIGEKYGCFNRH